MSEQKVRRSFFESRFMSTKIKSSNVSLFPEALLGYLVGPIFALACNGVVNIWLVQYWDKVLGLGSTGPGKLFQTILPIASAILIIVGNLIVGRLMERKPSFAGKARPLILIGMPFIAVALLLLFLAPFPGMEAGETKFLLNPLTLVMVAIGYNMYYAFAWPIYYTSHSALVNLSTRDGSRRGLLSTAIMAAQLGASGLSGMAGGFLVSWLGLLPKYTYTTLVEGELVTKSVSAIKDLPQEIALTHAYDTVITPQQAHDKWLILMAVLAGLLVIGCILEYFFTRERITEEHFKMNADKEAAKEIKKTPMSEQIKVCLKDKYWWLIIIFYFLYQFGGMMKNNDLSFYSQAFTGDTVLSGTINTVGAIPTALGMALVWPIARKITKSKTIVAGSFLAFLGGSIAFLNLIPAIGNNAGAVYGIAVSSFIVKALGTSAAMYIGLAVMAHVLDHQEAVFGIRTDGFTMAVYGSIMVAMSGICNGIIVGIDGTIPDGAQNIKQVVHTILSYGVEAVGYLVMGILFIFMTVEKFTRVDNKAIIADQKAKVQAEGGTWVEPEERARLEKEENARLVEEQRVAQLKLDCEKKGLNYEEEEAKYQAQKAEKDKAAEEKKAAAQAKKDAAEAALTEEQKAAREAKAVAIKEKQEANDAKALVELNEYRVKFGREAAAVE